MEKTPTKIWFVFGIVVMLLITLVMGWFVGRFIPGTPNSPSEDTISEKYVGRFDTGINAVDTKDVPFGNALLVEDVTQGYKYDYAKEKEQQFDPKEFDEYLQESDFYSFDYAPFELLIGETKVVSGEAFKEWYPDFSMPETSQLPSYYGSKLPAKAFLVTVTAKNPSESESIMLPNLALWSEDFNQRSEAMGLGAYPCPAMTGLMYPKSYPEDYSDFSFTDKYVFECGEWAVLKPGESKEIVFPYYVYKNSFADTQNFEEIDLGRFCLEVTDYDPGIRYRFWLA